MFKLKYYVAIFISQGSCFSLAAFCSLLFLATNSLTAQADNQSFSRGPQQTAAASANNINAEQETLNPQVIERLLKQQFKVIKQEPSSSNPFPTLIPRSITAGTLDTIDSKYEVLEVKSFDDKGFFQHQKILLVTVSYVFLEARIKMGNRSAGLFAFDGSKLTYLNGFYSATNVAKVLRCENRSLSEGDPEMFANLFAMTILRRDNDRIDVMQSPDNILKLDHPNAAKMNEMIKRKKLGRLYSTTVNKAELEKCKGQILKPQLSYDNKSGWQCRFIGLCGFMHTMRVPFALVAYDISISPNFDIKVTDNILSSNIII